MFDKELEMFEVKKVTRVGGLFETETMQIRPKILDDYVFYVEKILLSLRNILKENNNINNDIVSDESYEIFKKENVNEIKETEITERKREKYIPH